MPTISVTTMRHIDDFEQLIFENFDDLIKRFDLKLISFSNEFGDEFRLVGHNSELFFTYDRGDLRCSFINPDTNRKYLVNLIYKLLYPKENQYIFSINDTPSMQIKVYSQVMRERLCNILEGDFSWANHFDKTY